MKSLKSRSEQAHGWYEKLVLCLRAGSGAWVAAGLYLSKLRKDNAYKTVLGEHPTWGWDDFLNQPEISLPYSTASKLMRVAEVFVEKLGLPDRAIEHIPYYRLKSLTSCITSENKDELLESAEHHSRADFERVLIKASTGIDQDFCAHRFREVTIQECEVCHVRRRKPYGKPKEKSK